MKSIIQIFLSFLLLFPIATNAQQAVSGKVIAIETKEGLPFANVVLTNIQTDSMIGMATEIDGSFTFIGIPSGSYKAEVSVLGFETKAIDKVIVGNKSVELGVIGLAEAAFSIGEISVSAERSYIESKPGKKIINIKKDLLNSGGSALEALTMAPSVEVGVGGEVSIRGERDVFVLINGRPTALSFLGAEKALKQIPVSSIEKIEVITNGGAEFEADGVGGVINVILKENSKAATEVTIGANLAAHPFSGSATAGIEFQKGKTALSLNYNIDKEQDNSFSKGLRQYKTINDNNTSRLEEVETKEDNVSHFVMGGITYEANEFTETGINLFYDNSTSNSSSQQKNVTQRIGLPQKVIHINGTSKNIDNFLGLEGFHNQELGERMKLSAKLNAFGGISNTTTRNKIMNDGVYSIQDNKSKSLFGNIGGGLSLESSLTDFLGMKVGLESNTLYFDVSQNSVNDSATVYGYKFTQNKQAFYATTDIEWGNFNFVIGARLEYFSSNGQPKEGIEFKQEYFNIYPNFQMMGSFEKANYNYNIMFSYSRRINRPEFEQLNPVINYNNSLNISQGNINLQPEFAHIFELTYELNFKKLSLSATIFDRYTRNVIQEKNLLQANNVILTTYSNEAQRNNIGGELFLKYDFAEWLDMSAFFTLYNKSFKGTSISLKNDINWNTKVIANIKPMAGFKIQLQLRYVGQQNNLFFSSKPYFTMNIGLNKSILKGKGSIFVNITDVFNSIKLESTTTQKDFVFNNTTRYSTRLLNIGFLYNFN